MGGSFRRVLNSEVVILSTWLCVQSLSIYFPPIFVSCLLIGRNGFTPLFRPSSMVKLMRKVSAHVRNNNIKFADSRQSLILEFPRNPKHFNAITYVVITTFAIRQAKLIHYMCVREGDVWPSCREAFNTYFKN